MIDFQEFAEDGIAHAGSDFSEEAASEDFRLHDADHDGLLNRAELGRLLAGHELLEDSIRKALEAGDANGDDYIHMDELQGRLQHLLESEFIEDFFLQKEGASSLLHTEL